MNYKFSDLIEVAKVQRLNDLFYKATGIPGAIIDLKGTIVTCSGWQELCTKFHRVNAETMQRCVESDTVFANQIGVGQKYTVFKCGNGLMVAASPITIGGGHVANFITSQFLFHPPDGDSFLEQARRFGFDEAAYIEAVGKIPVIDEERVQPFLEYFSEFAAMMGEMGLKQLRQLEAAAALRESEQRWATTLSSIGDAVIATDKDGRVTFMNAVAEGLTGWTLTEAAAKPVTDVFKIINERTRKAVDNPVTRVLQEGIIVALANHTVLLSRDGREIPIDDSGAPVRDAAGNTIGVVLVFRDITERKAAEQALWESQTQMSRAQEMAHLGSWELDLVNNRLSWSDEVYRIFGLQPQEFGATYDAFLEAVHPEDREAVDAAYSGSLQEGRDTYEIEHRVVRRSSGEIRIVHEKCEHFRDGTGRIVKSVGMVHDITKRKAAEQALREARDNLEQRVKEKTTELRSIIEASLDPFVTISREGKISDVNAATELVTGFTRQELIGTDFASYFTNPEEARQGYERVFAEESVRDYHLEIRHRNGEITPVLYNASVYRDEAGTVIGVFAAARDITEQKRAEEARSSLAAIVESSDDAIISEDLDGAITSWNKGAERLYGYSTAEVLGRPISIIMPPDQQDEMAVFLRRIRRRDQGRTLRNKTSQKGWRKDRCFTDPLAHQRRPWSDHRRLSYCA